MLLLSIYSTKNMSVKIQISINEGLYIRNPQDSDLGRRIIENSIILIDELGIESFNFKKLSTQLNSTETSIYRYFENKHTLLLYLVNWYWEWVSYLITLNTMNIEAPRKKLQIIIHSFVAASFENSMVSYVNENKLQKIVIQDGLKAYHTKEVDDENSKGYFKSYKNLILMVSQVISAINPNFKYPYALATNLFEMANNHIYFAQHLPKLTDVSIRDNKNDEIEKMLNYFAEKLLS